MSGIRVLLSRDPKRGVRRDEQSMTGAGLSL